MGSTQCAVFSVSQSSFEVMLAQDPTSLEVLSLVSFKDSLKAEGSSPDLGSSVFGSIDFGVIYSGVLLWVTIRILDVSLSLLSRFSSIPVDLTQGQLSWERGYVSLFQRSWF
jgi:hypothetical protein